MKLCLQWHCCKNDYMFSLSGNEALWWRGNWPSFLVASSGAVEAFQLFKSSRETVEGRRGGWGHSIKSNGLTASKSRPEWDWHRPSVWPKTGTAQLGEGSEGPRQWSQWSKPWNQGLLKSTIITKALQCVRHTCTTETCLQRDTDELMFKIRQQQQNSQIL